MTVAAPRTRGATIVLVTGADGFIGRHACRWLADRGDTVRQSIRRGTTDRTDSADWFCASGDIGDQPDGMLHWSASTPCSTSPRAPMCRPAQGPIP